MANLEITDAGVKISFTFWEKLLTYKGNMLIPTNNIRGATEDPTFMNDSLVFRTRGAIGVPGLFSMGTFAKNGDRVLACWRRGQNVLVLELQGMKWNRIALGISSAKALATEINATLIASDSV